MINSSKPIERTTPRVNRKANYGLWVTQMWQWRVTDYNKCPALVRDIYSEGGYACRGQGLCGKSLYLLLNFSVNLKCLLKHINTHILQLLLSAGWGLCPHSLTLHLAMWLALAHGALAIWRSRGLDGTCTLGGLPSPAAGNPETTMWRSLG